MFRVAKDRLSGGKSLAFAVQKTVFWEAKHICLGNKGGVKGEWKGSGGDDRGLMGSVKTKIAF